METIRVESFGQPAEAVLQASREAIGPTIGITLSEDTQENVRWLIEVQAKTLQGEQAVVGRTFTVSPNATGAGKGPACRLVAIATCPGAVSWALLLTPYSVEGSDLDRLHRVTASCEVGIARAEQKMIEDAPLPGVYPVNPIGTGRLISRVVTSQVVIVAAAAAVQLLAEQPFRADARIINTQAAGGNSLWLGPDVNTTAATGFELKPGAVFEVTHGRAIFGFSTAGATAGLYVEEG